MGGYQPNINTGTVYKLKDPKKKLIKRLTWSKVSKLILSSSRGGGRISVPLDLFGFALLVLSLPLDGDTGDGLGRDGLGAARTGGAGRAARAWRTRESR